MVKVSLSCALSCEKKWNNFLQSTNSEISSFLYSVKSSTRQTLPEQSPLLARRRQRKLRVFFQIQKGTGGQRSELAAKLRVNTCLLWVKRPSKGLPTMKKVKNLMLSVKRWTTIPLIHDHNTFLIIVLCTSTGGWWEVQDYEAISHPVLRQMIKFWLLFS